MHFLEYQALLFGGFIYTVLLPSIQNILGPDLGSFSLYTLIGQHHVIFYLVDVIIGLAFIWAAFGLNKLEKATDMKWLYAGIGLALLNAVVFLSVGTNRIIGASTAYPYVADLITGTTNNSYFPKIKGPGQWEVLFLTGAFVSGIVISLFRKEFKITFIHSNWKKYKGNSVAKRTHLGIYWRIYPDFWCKNGRRLYKWSYPLRWNAAFCKQPCICCFCFWRITYYRKILL